MNSFSTLFATKSETNSHSEDIVKEFLTKFPEEEFWRFFVERNRYDKYKEFYFTIYNLLNSNHPLSDDQAENFEKIENELQGKTLGKIEDQLKSEKNFDLITYLVSFFPNIKNIEKSTPLTQLLNRQIAWIGFEEREPGYLNGVTQGWKFILDHLLDRKQPFSIDFIKKLHRICTNKVNNMVEQTIGGQFRSTGATWSSDKLFESQQGLKETVEYIQLAQNNVDKRNKTGISIFLSKYGRTFGPFISNFNQFSAYNLSEELWDMLKNENCQLHYALSSYNDKEEALTVIHQNHINTLKAQLAFAITKEEKLSAIFKFLKYIVLHHPFADGVGRTYSMLLSQYLFMHENLLPVILINSNMIPGLSVQELVNEYLRGEKEMKKILATGEINNILPHIHTLSVLNDLDNEDKKVFNTCLDEYRIAKNNYIAGLCSTFPREEYQNNSL